VIVITAPPSADPSLGLIDLISKAVVYVALGFVVAKPLAGTQTCGTVLFSAGGAGTNRSSQQLIEVALLEVTVQLLPNKETLGVPTPCKADPVNVIVVVKAAEAIAGVNWLTYGVSALEYDTVPRTVAAVMAGTVMNTLATALEGQVLAKNPVGDP